MNPFTKLINHNPFNKNKSLCLYTIKDSRIDFKSLKVQEKCLVIAAVVAVSLTVIGIAFCPYVFRNLVRHFKPITELHGPARQTATKISSASATKQINRQSTNPTMQSPKKEEPFENLISTGNKVETRLNNNDDDAFQELKKENERLKLQIRIKINTINEIDSLKEQIAELEKSNKRKEEICKELREELARLKNNINAKNTSESKLNRALELIKQQELLIEMQTNDATKMKEKINKLTKMNTKLLKLNEKLTNQN